MTPDREEALVRTSRLFELKRIDPVLGNLDSRFKSAMLSEQIEEIASTQ
jgi:hypothetical protein